MPEGDSVWRAANQLHKALAGQTLLASDFRVPRFATLNLAGWTVAEVVPRGRHLLMRAVGPDGKRVTIHSHLKMEGSWQIYPPGRQVAETRLHGPVCPAHGSRGRRGLFPGHCGSGGH